MIIKRVGPVSCARIAATLYAIIGLAVGALVSLAAIVGLASSSGNAPKGIALGIGAIVVMPIVYGGLGFVFTLATAWLYNILAGFVGGIQVDVE